MRRTLPFLALVACGYDFAGTGDDGTGGAEPSSATTGTFSATGSGVTSAGTNASGVAATAVASATATTTSNAVVASSSATGSDTILPPCGEVDDFVNGIDPMQWDVAADGNGSVTDDNGNVTMRAGNGGNDYAGISLRVDSPSECAAVVRLVSGEANLAAFQDNGHLVAFIFTFGTFSLFSTEGQVELPVPTTTPNHLGLVLRGDEIWAMAKHDGSPWETIFVATAPAWTNTYRTNFYAFGNGQQSQIDDFGVEPIRQSDLALP